MILQYEQFIYMMNKSYFIITDNWRGSKKKKHHLRSKPLLVMRNTTERPKETVEAGTIKTSGYFARELLSKDKY